MLRDIASVSKGHNSLGPSKLRSQVNIRHAMAGVDPQPTQYKAQWTRGQGFGGCTVWRTEEVASDSPTSRCKQRMEQRGACDVSRRAGRHAVLKSQRIKPTKERREF